MPAEHDLDPPAMTEHERLAKRRYHAFFAFETMPFEEVECPSDSTPRQSPSPGPK